MRNNQDGTFLDPDGTPRSHADRPARPPAVPARVDAAWQVGKAAGKLSEELGARMAAHSRLEGPR